MKIDLKASVACLLMALSLPVAGFAAMCTLDDVPAATLLLPYFEVDWQDPAGVNTVFTINNATPEPALAHVTFWTDWSQPTIDFDVFLTGYDVQAINMYDFFQGNLPITADLQNDPGDEVSPHGQNPGWDGDFPSCLGLFPYQNPALSGTNLTRLRNGHTGLDVLGLGCMGSDTGDGIARGYVTIDSVNRCSLVFPSEPGYFTDDGTGIANNRNVLWGSYRILDPEGDRMFGEALVSIEAEDGFDGSTTSTGYTFYGRYVDSGADNREPLANVWAVEYTESAEASTELLVWRDSNSTDIQGFYTCGEGPSWLPLEENEVVIFDQEENAIEHCWGSPDGTPEPPAISVGPCLPLETQRIALEAELQPAYTAGWIALNLNTFDDDPDDAIHFGIKGDIHQAYVTAVTSGPGQVQVGYGATVLNSACNDADPLITGTGEIPQAPPVP